MSRLVAVLDLGKTNKKVLIIDEALRPVASVSASFPAAAGRDGVLCEPVDAIWAWFKSNLAALYRQHPFHAISVSAHGATWAAVDAAGALAFPVIAYDHALDENAQRKLDADFYQKCGRLEELQDETGSCDLPLLINPAKGVLFAQQQWPADFARASHLLNYPGYWGFLLTGRRSTEPTYAFCHTFLHDVRRRVPSRAAHALGVARLLDLPLLRPWDRLGELTPALQAELGLPALPVTAGVHDSNASFLPYLIKHGDRDLVLNSTGTWCVAMHRVAEVRYRPEELGQKVNHLVDCTGKLVKSSILMGGQDYALYRGFISGERPEFDAARLDAALADPSRLVMPGAFPSQFPMARGGLKDGHAAIGVADLKAGRVPGWFRDPRLAYDLLHTSLALQSEVALARTGMGERTAIFIEGGFRNNAAYCALIAALFPNQPVFRTDLAEATASGAALLGQALLAGCDPAALAGRVVISEEPVARPRLANLASYRSAWLQAAG